jgi:hypothetical protein
MRCFALWWVAAVCFATPAYGVCNFDLAKQQARALLEPVAPKVSGDAVYQQALIFPNGSSELLRAQGDYEFREIPFVLLDVERCSERVVMESRRIVAGQLSPPLGGFLQLVVRKFGAIWNDFNTQSVTGQPNSVAVFDKWIFYSRPGYCYYVPYSPDLDRLFPELNAKGIAHFNYDMEEALTGLLVSGDIQSSDRPMLRKLLPRLFLSESIDPFEFKVANQSEKLRISRQPFVTLGANGKDAYVLKVSTAKAKGPMQIWDRSCEDILYKHKDAGLASDCNSATWGKDSHVGNIAAAALEILIHRDTLALKKFLGKKVTRRTDYYRMLEASYNGGPGHVIKAFKRYGNNWDKPHFAKSGKLSKDSLRLETIDYLLKCDYLAGT